MMLFLGRIYNRKHKYTGGEGIKVINKKYYILNRCNKWIRIEPTTLSILTDDDEFDYSYHKRIEYKNKSIDKTTFVTLSKVK